MATETEIGQLNGIDLEMETIEDTFERALARYEYPYVDGDDLEDMGQKAHVIRIRCYFYDGDGGDNYEAHKILINNLAQSSDLDELVHPKYGTMQGKVESITVRADDRIRCAEIDLSLVEQRRQTLDLVAPEDVAQSAETSFLTSQNQQAAELTEEIVTVLGWNPPLPADIPSPSLLAQVNAQTGAMRQFVRDIQDQLEAFDALANEVTQPVNSLVATINYSADLPGRILGTITRAVERVANLYTSLRQFPARLTSSLSGAILSLQAQFERFAPTSAGALCLMHLRIAGAQRLALEAAYSYGDDQNRRLSLTAQPPAFDAMGRYTAPAEVTPVANAQELESSLSDVRGMIAAVVSDFRTMQALKDMARQLLEHVYTDKLTSERIITIQVDTPMPLHIVCLRYGLSYTEAQRIIDINRIPWPSAVKGGVKIYV